MDPAAPATAVGRALYELNIDGICANTPAAKGRVERAHQTLQDRLVKELRLQGISTIKVANAFMPTFIADHNGRFGKAPRDAHDAHRPIRTDEDLDSIFCWRELRKVTKTLTLHYERKLYLLTETPDARRLIGKYVEVFHFPEGRIEIRAGGMVVLRIAQLVQAHREIGGVGGPSTAHRPNGKRVPGPRLPGSKTQRELGPAEDLRGAIATAAISEHARA